MAVFSPTPSTPLILSDLSPAAITLFFRHAHQELNMINDIDEMRGYKPKDILAAKRIVFQSKSFQTVDYVQSLFPDRQYVATLEYMLQQLPLYIHCQDLSQLLLLNCGI